LTNFHLPKTPSLLVACAFSGTDQIFKAYRRAIKNNYRFYVFGDALLLF